MSRITTSAPVDPTDRFTQQIKSLQEQVAELQRKMSKVPEPLRRAGCGVRRDANQSVPNNTLTFITWDAETEDTDGYISVPSATVTVPAGLGGMYGITLNAFSSTAWGTVAGDQLLITAGGIDYYLPTRETGNGSKTGTIVVPLAAGGTVSCWVKQQTGGAINFIGRLNVYRVTP